MLSAEELAQFQDGGEISAEDILAAQMTAKAAPSGISFVAFTATPKAKTMELFGRRPDPAAPADYRQRCTLAARAPSSTIGSTPP